MNVISNYNLKTGKAISKEEKKQFYKNKKKRYAEIEKELKKINNM